MKRRNNKGFSLVELLIAVAVMALLITPIIVQLAHTLETSAQAKEKQYTDENAEYVMEYFRKTEKAVLDKGGSVDGQIDITSLVEHKTDDVTPVSCDILADGTTTVLDVVNYNVTDYTLDSVKLGRKNNTYTRKVTMDDLANKIMDAGYRIDYGMKGKDVEEGYEIQTDGSAIKYDDDGHVAGIYCKAGSDDYQNPNDVNLGYVQNLDSSTMAIVEGNAATLDTQFEADIVSAITDIDTRVGITAKNTINSDIARFTDESPVYRTVIITTSGIEDVGGNLTGYNVKVDILYVITNLYRGNALPERTYNIYDQNFNTDEAPDVYFIYEPYVKAKSNLSIAQYASDEYIFVSADDYTNGADGKDPAKIYLVRPETTWLSANGVTQPGTDNSSFWYQAGGTYRRVNIHVNQLYDGVDSTRPLKMYTNVSMYYDEDDKEWYISDGTRTQFDSTPQTTNGGTVGQTVCNRVTAVVPKAIAAYGNGVERCIYPIYNDPRYAGRLYSITVTLTDPKGRTTHYKGTKGAD